MAVLLVMIAALGLCLVGCNNTDTDSLSNYQIIYSDIDYNELVHLQNAGYDNDCDFNRYSAEKLQAEIKSKFGVTLPIGLDSATKQSPYEILVGATNRQQSDDLKLAKLGEQNYIIAEHSGKLVVCGGSYGETWQAVKLLCDNLQGDKPAITQQGVTKGFQQNGSVKLTTIACIGDSLTWGAESISPEYLSYPAFLQRMVWKNCLVKKYANSGKTMNENIEYGQFVFGFTTTPEWVKCLADAQSFDYVLIMLGTNDSYCVNLSGYDWCDNFHADFVNSFLKIIGQIKQVNGNVKFTLMNCPKVYANGYNTAEICNYQDECVEMALSEGYNVDLYDMASATQFLNQSVYFAPDGLHFNSKGYQYVANLVKTMLAQKFDLEL